MHEAEQVLTGIAEAHSAADAGFVVGSRAAHIEGDHALVLVPDIHHAIDFFAARFDVEDAEQVLPVGFQLAEGSLDVRVCLIAGHHLFGRCFIDDASLHRIEIIRALLAFPFFFNRILAVAQNKHKRSGFAGFKRHIEAVGRDRIPARGDGVFRFAAYHRFRCLRSAVRPEEIVAARVEAGDGGIYRIEGVVIAPLAVFRLVVNGAADDFELAGGEVALVVGHVIHGVPEAPFHIGEEL